VVEGEIRVITVLLVQKKEAVLLQLL